MSSIYLKNTLFFPVNEEERKASALYSLIAPAITLYKMKNLTFINSFIGNFIKSKIFYQPRMGRLFSMVSEFSDIYIQGLTLRCLWNFEDNYLFSGLINSTNFKEFSIYDAIKCKGEECLGSDFTMNPKLSGGFLDFSGQQIYAENILYINSATKDAFIKAEIYHSGLDITIIDSNFQNIISMDTGSILYMIVEE